jgi:hypothetical protein
MSGVIAGAIVLTLTAAGIAVLSWYAFAMKAAQDEELPRPVRDLLEGLPAEEREEALHLFGTPPDDRAGTADAE